MRRPVPAPPDPTGKGADAPGTIPPQHFTASPANLATVAGQAKVSLRVTATDTAGNSLTETILNAYRTSA